MFVCFVHENEFFFWKSWKFPGVTKPLQVVVAGKTHINFITPRLLGKQSKIKLNLADHVDTIECMAFDSLSGNLIISDTGKKKIFLYNMRTKYVVRIFLQLISTRGGRGRERE